jgi:uncharacterized protein
VIEESQLIVPENVTKDQTTMVGTYEEIIRLGRNYGIGCTLITQRPQSVNKEVLNQTECLFVLQVNGAHERKALKEWIVHQGLDAKIINELPALPKGTAFVWSPQWLGILDKVTIGRKWTFDSTATPKPGQPRAGGEVKPIDMEDLRSKMAEAVREAEANDPKLLQRRISELERELKAKPAAAMDPESQQRAMAAIHRAEILEARNADLEKIIVQVQIRLMNLTGNIRDNMLPPLEHLQELVGGTVAEGGRVAEKLADEQKARRSAMALRRSQDDQASAARRDAYLGTKAFAAKVNGDTPSLPIGERAVLQALIQYPNGLRREQLTVLTGYKRSTRNTYVQRLGERGYIATEGERIQATTEGIAALPDAEPLPTGPALQEFWLARLPEGEAAILRVLIDAYPKSVSRDHLSEATGYKRSTRNTYLQRLSAKELVSGGESIVAAEELF